jgi:HK97 family phage major capsid protein
MDIHMLVSAAEQDLEDAQEAERSIKAQIKRILDGAQTEKRTHLNADEDKEVDKLFAAAERAKAEVKKVERKLARAQAIEAEEAEIDRQSSIVKPHAPAAKREQRFHVTDNRSITRTETEDGPKWVRSIDGRNAAVEAGERWSDNEIVREATAKTAERDAHIVGTHGDFAGMLRSISTTSGASAIVPTVWANSIIDKARNQAVMFRAGATLVPMGGKVEQIGRLTQDPSPAFRAEGNAFPATDPALDYIQLTATTLGTVVVASIEVLQDAPNANSIVENSLAAAMALEIDKAAMFGQLGATGTNDEGSSYGLASPYPKGLLKSLVDYNSGSQIVGAFPTNGTAQTAGTPWAEMLSVYYLPVRANERVSAIVSNVALEQQYAGMVNTLYDPIRKPEVLANVPWLTTNAIPSFTRGTMTNRATDVFAGDFSQLLIGQRLGLEVRVLNERYAELGQVGFLAVWRGDVAVARPKAFAAYRALQGAA